MSETLIDSHARTINYLRVSITDRCNLRCTYCMPADGVSLLSHHDILRYEEIVRVVRVAVNLGIKKVRITGGEPLIRKGVCDLIAQLSTLSGLDEVTLTTNGVLLAGMAEELFSSGLRRINISIDSLCPDRFEKLTRGGSLNRVLAGLEEALRLGFHPIKINVVTMRSLNVDEVHHFSDLTHRWPVDVRFIEYMPVNGSTEWSLHEMITGMEVLMLLQERGPVEELSRMEGSHCRMLHLPGAKGRIGLINPLSEHFCGECNRLRLTADGQLRSCLFSDATIDLRRILHSGHDDAALESAIREATAQKPRTHGLGTIQRRKCDAIGMWRIGG